MVPSAPCISFPVLFVLLLRVCALARPCRLPRWRVARSLAGLRCVALINMRRRLPAFLRLFRCLLLCAYVPPREGSLLDWDKLKMGDMKAQCLAPPRAVIGPEHGCMAPSMSARPRGQGRAGKLAPHALSWPNASPLTRNASPPTRNDEPRAWVHGPGALQGTIFGLAQPPLRPEPGFSPAKNAPYGIYRLAESGYIRWPWEYKIVITFMTGSEKKKG